MSRARSPTPGSPPARLRSVDALRGATILLMVLVNNPGDWGSVYWPLLHAEWHGCTPTDLVFPFFLFVVGVSIVLALGRRVEAGGARGALVAKTVRRAAVLFALGLLLSGYPFGLFGPRGFGELLATWRIPGVLQRIAVCYLLAALLYLFTRRRALIVWTVALLVGYWLLLTRVPPPGLAAPDLASRGDHLAGWLDRTVLGEHVWSLGVVYDPEGILSTLAALGTTLLGVFAGQILTSSGPAEPPERTTARLFVYGSLLATGGYIWSWWLPLNKALWTSSYAVLTAGLAAMALALCHWALDASRRRPERPEDLWTRVLTTWGLNAITVFVGSGLIAKTLLYIRPGGEGSPSLYGLLHQHLFASWLPPYPASLAFALSWVAVWGVILAVMRRRGWVLKV